VTLADPTDVLAPFRARFARAVDGIAAPVVVGCSGGADSTALLALTVDAGLAPIAVHVDHGLRPGSADDALHVAELAARFGARFEARAVTVDRGPNLEERARDARYASLEAARASVGATAVFVAHTADDQAETVLLNLLRGAATAGLAGMRARRDTVVRPLLEFRRAETTAVCDALGVRVVRDPMNDDEKFRRVAVRHRVLPLLDGVAGRDIVPVLARQAEILGEESDYLDDLARAAWPGGRPPSARSLVELPAVLARRAVRVWLGPPPPSSAEVARVLDVAAGRCRATELTGGRTVRRTAGQLRVERHGER
jgi:tRNA(Ile)-lysidine synthase